MAFYDDDEQFDSEPPPMNVVPMPPPKFLFTCPQCRQLTPQEFGVCADCMNQMQAESP